ncbi:UNVERIFIED_CONTAM: hypothetical protein ABIE34_003498 [Jeotgalibacillus campisalis]
MVFLDFFAQSYGAWQSFPRRGKRPKATAQQNEGELYSGPYARKYGMPRASSRHKVRGQESGARSASTQITIAPAQTVSMLTILLSSDCQ